MSLVEAFIFTNGAEIAKHCEQCLKAQTVPCPYRIIQGKSLLDAIQFAMEESVSDFFIKLDDDMLLHPRAIEYLTPRLRVCRERRNLAMYGCRLWEPWGNRTIRCIKAYKTKACRDIGFRSDKRGKIDRAFVADMTQKGYRHLQDRSVIAVHGLRSLSDQQQYRRLWAKNAGKTVSELRSVDKDQTRIVSVVPSYNKQVKWIRKIDTVNEKTKFGKLLRDG